MGVRVYLWARADRITPEAWRAVYAETWRVIQAFPGEATTPGYRVIAGERVIALQRNLEVESRDLGGRGWRVSGDLRSKRTGETFEFPETFGRATLGAPPSRSPADDVLAVFARGEGLPMVFGEKTQGEPYHELITAVGTLVENRFPRDAIMTGDLSADDGPRACDLLTRALGGRFEPPVALDRERVRERLRPALAGPALDEAVKTLCPPQPSRWFGVLYARVFDMPAMRIGEELDRAVMYSDVEELSDGFRELVKRFAVQLGEAARGLEAEGRFADLRSREARQRALALIALGTDRNRLYLTEDAWSEIEQEAPEALQLLITAALGDASERNAWRLTRALFESTAVRSYALSHWSEARDREA